MIQHIIKPGNNNKAIWGGPRGKLAYSYHAATSSSFTNDHTSITTRETVNSNTLLAEDFSRGAWYSYNCDQANASGTIYQANQEGWCGTIYADAILAANPGAVVNLGGGEYAGTTGYMSGVNNGNMADRDLTEAVEEIWLRFYIKPLTGYTFGAEKVLTFNDNGIGGAGIKWGNWSWNCGAGSATSTGNCTMGFPGPGEDVCNSQNYTMTSGVWHFIELHMKLNTIYGTANGEFHCWADACGTGTFPVNPGGSPTLRFSRTNVNYNRNNVSEKITTLWFECWSNPLSTGERYWRSIYASKGGQVGFASNP